jgi:hypothetical protein
MNIRLTGDNRNHVSHRRTEESRLIRNALAAILLSLAAFQAPHAWAAPAPVEANPYRIAANTHDPVIDQASRTARAAVSTCDQLMADLNAAQTPQEKHQARQSFLGFAFDTLRTILLMVDSGDASQAGPLRAQIRTLASRPLQPGGSPDENIRGAYRALQAIAVMRSY